jgi:hypothetical protein
VDVRLKLPHRNSSASARPTMSKCLGIVALCLVDLLPCLVSAQAGLGSTSGLPTSTAPPPASHITRAPAIRPATDATTERQLPSGTPTERADRVAVTLCLPDCKVQKGEDKDKDKCVTAAYDFLGKLAWPVTALLIFVLLLLNRKTLSPLFRFLSRIKAGDVEFEFKPDDAMRAKTSITEAYQEFKKTAEDAYSQIARMHAIPEYFDRAMVAIREKVEGTVVGGKALSWSKDARATLHIPDVVLKEFTYQLLDYVPRGGGSGRRFSSRRGILGRAWRLERSFGAADALEPSNAVGAKSDDTHEMRLVQEWGMTRKEAASWQQEPRRAFLCAIVREADVGGVKGIAQGVIYIDSLTPGAFGDDSMALGIADWAEKHPTVVQLGMALGEATKDFRKGGTFLEF